MRINEENYVIEMKKNMKIKKRRIMLTAAAGIVVFSLVSSNVRESIALAAENIVKTISGNSKNDFAEEVNEKAEAQGVKLSMDKVIREDNEIKIRYKLNFDDDISSFKTLGSDQLFKKTSVFYSDVFENCNIYLNGNKLNIDHDDNSPDKVVAKYYENGCILNEEEINNYYKNMTKDKYEEDDKLLSNWIFYYEINDISISEHELQQELVVLLQDANYTNDLDIKLQFNEIKIGDKVIKGPWKLSYNMKNGQYTNDIEKTPLNINAKTSNGSTININGYSISNTGLKIYAEDTTSDEIRFKEIERIINLYPDVATKPGELTKKYVRETYEDKNERDKVSTMPIIRFHVTNDISINLNK